MEQEWRSLKKLQGLNTCGRAITPPHVRSQSTDNGARTKATAKMSMTKLPASDEMYTYANVIGFFPKTIDVRLRKDYYNGRWQVWWRRTKDSRFLGQANEWYQNAVVRSSAIGVYSSVEYSSEACSRGRSWGTQLRGMQACGNASMGKCRRGELPKW